jgi:predicted transcriptional regulator
LLWHNNPAYAIIKVMTKEHLIKLAGSQVELAKLLGISQPAVSAWKTIPEARIWQLKVMRPEWFEGQK